jgi:probable HAF family extracellular repeat protein
MHKRLFVALLLPSLLPFATPAEDGIFFMALPTEALPSDVGANAFATVGSFFDGSGGLYWMPTSGVQGIGGVGTAAVSLDGKTIVGRAADNRGIENAAIWKDGSGWRLLGPIRPNAQPCDLLLTGAFGASDDGKVIVGLGWDGCSYARAFRWEESTGMVDLGTLNGRSTRANDVSGDGRVVIGWGTDPTGPRIGAKWVNGRQEMITGPNGRPVGEAFAANRDGSLIVGQVCDYADVLVSRAWTWTAANGVRCFPVRRPDTIPNLPYTTAMMATSDDGSVIGGSFHFGLDAEALIWLDGGEGQFLKDYLRANGLPDAFRGWINTGFIQGVSPDGRTLVGYGAGPRGFTGYIVIFPERGSR